MTKITAPGVYPLSEQEYHADPCPEPSLSASIAHVLLDRSPYHAKLQHPRLNPDYRPDQKKQFDLGSAAHALLLEGGEEKFVVIEADDYKTKAAREARDAAYAADKIPLLPEQLAAVRAMVRAARAQIARHEEASDAFRDGKAEQTLAWLEDGVWCRCRLDWLPAGGNLFYDFKTTSGSANPEKWGQRQFYDIGADIQAAMYRRGIRAVLGVRDPHFRFVVQETEPPHALAVVELSPMAVAFADRKVDQALRWWRWCLDHDRWPGYPSRVAYVDPPPWVEKRWLEREQRQEVDAEAGIDIFEKMIEWQAPLEDA